MIWEAFPLDGEYFSGVVSLWSHADPMVPLTVYSYAYLKAEILICWHVNLKMCLL